MRRPFTAILLLLITAVPVSAQGLPPKQNTQKGASNQTPSEQSIAQSVRSNLEQAGYTDIQMVPSSFLVRAKDPNGNPVMMTLSPDAIEVRTERAPDQDKRSVGDQPTTTGTPEADPNCAKEC